MNIFDEKILRITSVICTKYVSKKQLKSPHTIDQNKVNKTKDQSSYYSQYYTQGTSQS